MLQTYGNGRILLLETIMNLHIHETGCATSKYLILRLLRFNSNK